MTTRPLARATGPVLGGLGAGALLTATALPAVAACLPPSDPDVAPVSDDSPAPAALPTAGSADLPITGATSTGAAGTGPSSATAALDAAPRVDTDELSRALHEAFAQQTARRGGPVGATVPAPRPAPAVEQDGRGARAAASAGSGSGGTAGNPGGTDAGAGPSAEAARVVELTNAARAAAGCRPLTVDPAATRAAQRHSEDMAANGYFSHDSADGRGFADRMRAAGATAPGAENIAAGQRTPEEVVDAWMDSPGHRANILDCDLSTIGVGLAGGNWTQDFGR